MPELIVQLRTLTDSFSKTLVEAVERAKLPDLGTGPHNPELSDLLKKDTDLFASDDITPTMRSRWMAGLWLLAGDLDRSHQISQDDSSSDGSFWHGIMHRREGDFSNAKYWFRRVGPHPVLDQLAGDDPNRYPDPFVFVDQVERSRREPNVASELMQLQWVEWQRLMMAAS